MATGSLVATLLGLGALAWVVAPLLMRPTRADAEAPRMARARELQSRRDMLLAALKDLADDKDLGKLAETDFAEMHGRLSLQAVQVLRELDTMGAEHERERQAEHPLLSYPGPRRPDGAR